MRLCKRFLFTLVIVGLFVPAADAQLRYGKLGIGAAGSLVLPMTLDFTESTGGLGGGLSVVYSPWENIALKALVGIGQVSYSIPANSTVNGVLYTTKTLSTTNMAMVNGYVTANFMPNSTFNPFIGIGAGYVYVDARTDKGAGIQSVSPPNRYDFTLLGTGGFDIFFDEFFSVTASVDYGMMQIDALEGYTKGGNKDAYLRAGVELRYYFFDQGFLTRLLEALKKRYEG